MRQSIQAWCGFAAMSAAAVVAGCGSTDQAASRQAASLPPRAPVATNPKVAAASTHPAAKAAEFRLTGIGGPGVSLASLRGKVVLLDFWGTWCIPCRQELPDIQKLYTTFGKSGFMVIGVTETSTPADVAQVRNALHLTFPLVAADDAVTRAYDAGPEGLPVAVLIDRTGNIAGRLSGVDPQKPVMGYWTPLIQKALRS